jgi:membrane associated rhomboid family serine protease
MATPQTTLHPAEAILRLCAAAAPAPWYPRLYAKETGIDLDSLRFFLEELWLDGLIHKTKGDAVTGPGLNLTPLGERVLRDPEALQRLREGQSLVAGDRGGMVRQALRRSLRPYVTRVLLALNLLVFGYGYLLARQVGADKAFLSGAQTAQVAAILQRSGMASAADIVRGEWWRLLTAGFVHVGLLHIFMNMAGLSMLGRSIETTWGRLAYLVIYLVADVGGTTLGVVYNPGGCAGASSAICGLLAAEALWIFLNRRYLPPSLLRRARGAMVMNLVLLVFISSFPGVSASGHFGGAVAGALAALLLHFRRFGPAGWRWLALAGFLPLFWLDYYAIERVRATDQKWQAVEAIQLARFHRPVREATKKALQVYETKASPLLQMHPTRRDPEKVESVLPLLAEQRRELKAVAERLARAGPFHDPDAVAAAQTGQECLTAAAELLAQAEHLLRVGEKRTDQERRALREQEEKVMELEQAWDDLFE